ncbi:carbohydrate kinase, YjeF related protein [Hydrogenobacter thermophilus TK-6]|uniref:Bifunctional NAD(P)H-hydrate repair enzyme n=1 Tax=Hydrogenobacter thermophilus (strain DSM 6534 / IAM 12695 / TK-6) TaxID=608538 RepID=D3DIN2_HYDTT|nr:bifunctional ADP-dependent NAD(P)H-hydrate dehydratase/NAD(P)H-hydrate epimerase [Hydrogenobacter thermophilus]ADO45610.1 carbohydrate kinase, YjeF related protein [Hydrogenobacter thermophilus TK-6]BAI69684.1 carbohydrate kinase, YjeF related protein [Hydrogenobacter thermophilus TK-6]
MRILKALEMSQIDSLAIKDIGIPSLLLMENAGLRLVEVIRKEFPHVKKLLFFIGKGNNGGDGLVAVRHLHLLGYKADYFLVFGEDLKGDARLNLEVLKRLGCEPLKDKPSDDYHLVVDAIFGTGFEPPVRGEARRWIEFINSLGKPVVAVDIPSGLCADSGQDYEPSVRANLTITFQFPKVCHVLYPSAKRCGKVYVANIGIPESLAKHINRHVLEKVKPLKREPDVHKGNMGHVLLVGSSVGKTGALIMSARAATRTGSGLVSVGVPESLNHIFEISLIEEMSLPLEGEERLKEKSADTIISVQENFTAIGVGMGMGRYEEGRVIIKKLLLGIKKPLLLDADGINNLADTGDLSILKEREHPTVLTPHVGEFARLSGYDKTHIIHHLIDVAQEFSQKWNCFLVLKSSRTVISTPDGEAFVSLRGSPAMAKGGTGDVLSGILTSLIGRKIPILEALKIGVFLHGLCGEIAQSKRHTESVKALDLVEEIPEAYNQMENESYPPVFCTLF